MKSIAIVGGGMLGMTVALRLARAGHDVSIFEAAPSCGGLAAPWQLGDVTWDRHYHVTLYSDTALRALLDDLGLGQRIHWVTTRTGFFTNGKMHSLSCVSDFLRFPPLSPVQKMRLGATILKASRITDWRALESLTAVEWLTRECGSATVETLWLPLLRAKLGTYAERASAAFIWAIIARMYAARRTGAKRELFGYVEGGYATVLERFEQRLRDLGVRLYAGCRVDRIEPDGGGVLLSGERGRTRFDAAIVTLAAPLAARLCPDLGDDERERLHAVEYQGIVCASLLSDTPLTPYYVTNITEQWVPFTAVIEMTSLVDRGAFHGQTLLYLPKYATPDDPVFRSDDAAVERDFLSALERMHPAFSRRSVRAFRISRVPYVFPVPTLHYSDRVPPQRTTIPGLYLANSAHIVNGTLNVNETVMLANRAAQLVA